MSLRSDDAQALARVLAALSSDAQLIHTPALATLRQWAEAHGATFAAAATGDHHAKTTPHASQQQQQQQHAHKDPGHFGEDQGNEDEEDESDSGDESDSASSRSSGSATPQHDTDAASEPDEERWALDEADAHDAALQVPGADQKDDGDKQQQPHEPSDEDVEAAAALKAEAAEAAAQGDKATAIDKLTAALRRCPHNAMYWGLRALYLLQAQRPAAALRDADRALRLNPQNVRALRVRGTVRRHLGDWAGALQDLNDAQAIDYDDATATTMKFVQARVSARHARAVAQQERDEARAQRRRARELRRRQRQQQKYAKQQQQQQRGQAGGGAGGPRMPPGLDALFSDPEVQAAMQDPEVAGKLMQAMQNPASVLTMMNDPKVGPVLTKLFSKMGMGGMGGMGAGMGAGMGGMGAGMGGMGAGMGGGAAPPPSSSAQQQHTTQPPRQPTQPAPPSKDELD